MADVSTLQCESCGAPLPIEHRFVRMVACRYCGSSVEITDEGLNPGGKFGKLVALPTRFAIGMSGKLRGRDFEVLGRVRYQHDEGVWDEWYLTFSDGTAGWLEEEEGETILARVETLRSPVPTFEQARVGTQFPVNGVNFFVTERTRARIAGAEGQLFYRAAPGKPVNFVDGNIGGRTAFLEYSDEGVEFGIGEPIERHEIVLETHR